jgi:hypothetical protein
VRRWWASELKNKNGGHHHDSRHFAFAKEFHMCAMMLSPNSLHLISVALSICRAKS